VQFKDDKKSQRWQHWQKIIQHAAEQSGRTVLPDFSNVSTLNSWVIEQGGLKVFLDPYAEKNLAQLSPENHSVTLLTGPEGGFSNAEREIAKAADFIPVRLGARIFRALLVTSLRKYLPAFSAVFISAIYYAGLHFLDNKTPVSDETLSLNGSFQLLSDAYHNVFSMQQPSAFLALCAVGLFLGFLRLRGDANLATCIGCHAGWVFQIRMSKSTSIVDFKSPYSFLVSHYDGVIGLFVAFWLLFVLAVFLIISHKNTLNTVTP
jgi:hypothetical protein